MTDPSPPNQVSTGIHTDELLDWLGDLGDFLGCLKLADPTTRDVLQVRRQQFVDRLEAAVLVPAPPEPQQGKHARTRYGGSCGTTPFYLFDGQCEPEYDQGHSVIVWYDDIHDLSLRAAAARSPTPAAQAWEPISSAPKDGRRVLLAWRGYVSEGWIPPVGEGWQTTLGSVEPTHWMPLPEPPVGSPAPAKEP